jgi:hypothetical protein
MLWVMGYGSTGFNVQSPTAVPSSLGAAAAAAEAVPGAVAGGCFPSPMTTHHSVAAQVEFEMQSLETRR